MTELAEIGQQLHRYHVEERRMPQDEWHQRKDDLVREEYARRLDEREQETIASMRKRISRAF